MLLITGGLGFIGLHTARALLEMGETCVLTQHHVAPVPAIIHAEMGTRLFIEPLDMTDADAFLALGKKYPITGIVHLAAQWNRNAEANALALFEDIRVNMAGLANAIQAAQTWEVKRLLVASTIGIYGSDESRVPWREDQPLPLTASHPIPAFKKCNEILADYLATRTGVSCITMRFGGIYGPLSRSRSFLPNLLVHAALEGTTPGLANMLGGITASDGGDTCYVKDLARAVALLSMAPTLPYRVYNVASGRPTKNQDIIEAIKKLVPGFDFALPSGQRHGAIPYQDISRLQQDTGYQPQYTIEQGIAEYIAWLRAGNQY